MNELEERERLNQQQRPPAATGFFGFRLGDLKGFRGSGDWRVVPYCRRDLPGEI